MNSWQILGIGLTVSILYLLARSCWVKHLVNQITQQGLLPSSNTLEWIPEQRTQPSAAGDSQTQQKSGGDDLTAPPQTENYPRDEVQEEERIVNDNSETKFTQDVILASMVAVGSAIEAIDWTALRNLKIDAATEFPEMMHHLQDYISEHFVDLMDPANWWAQAEAFGAQEAAFFAENHHLLDNGPDLEDSSLDNSEPEIDPLGTDVTELIPDDAIDHAPGALLESLHDSIAENLGELGAGTLVEGIIGGIPLLTSMKSSYRELKLLKNDETEIATALKNSCLDVAGTGAGFAAGAKVGGVIGSFVPVAGSAAGATVGGILGAMAGRSATGKIKVAKFVETVKSFQAQLPICAANVENIKESGRLQLIDDLERGEKQLQNDLECIAAKLQTEVDRLKAKVSIDLQELPDVFLQALQKQNQRLEMKKAQLLSAAKPSMFDQIWPNKKSIFFRVATAWFASAQSTIRITIATCAQELQNLEEPALPIAYINGFVKKYRFSDSRLAEHLQSVETDYQATIRQNLELRKLGTLKAEVAWKSAIQDFKEKSIQVQHSMTRDTALEVARLQHLKAEVEKEGLKLGKRDLFKSASGPAFVPNSCNDQLLTLFRTLCASRSGFYIHPKIPEKKNINLRKRCSVESNERSLVLLDCTVFGSAKNGMLFTDKAIWYANDWTGKQSGIFSIPYEDFVARKIAVAGTHEVDLGLGSFFNCAGSGWSPGELAGILNSLRNHLKDS